jgi:hypothetical protein
MGERNRCFADPRRPITKELLTVRFSNGNVESGLSQSVKGGVKPGRWGGVKVDQSMDVGLL